MGARQAAAAEAVPLLDELAAGDAAPARPRRDMMHLYTYVNIWLARICIDSLCP
jgi:hypothetical protein